MASDALSRLKATYQKKGSGRSSPTSTTVWPELVKSAEADNKLMIHRYYEIVTRGTNWDATRYQKFEEALNYYRIVVENAHQHATAVGNLLLLAQETPGLQTLYGGVHVDASQVRKYLEEALNIQKARKVKWLMNDPEAIRQHGALKVTEAGKWAEADDEIADLTLYVRRFANAENQLGNIMNGFTTRSVMIAKITTIREAGLEEVWVDPTRETLNE